ERDDALACPWAATHQDHGLLLVLEALRDLSKDGIEYDKLLVQQHEHALALDHRSRVVEQSLARLILALQHGREHRGAVAPGETIRQVLCEIVGTIAREERVPSQQVGVTAVVQLAIRGVAEVMKVGAGRESDTARREGRV